MDAARSYLVFDGVSSLDFGLTIEEPRLTQKPRRKVTRISVPGRSGDYLADEGGYENAEVSYRVWCRREERDRVLESVDEITRWLSAADYRPLYDNYDPDYFRRAVCLEPLDAEIIARRFARQELVFSCDPYKYSRAGNQMLRFRSTTAKLYNKEGYDALPLIRVYGAGTLTLTVNGQSWTLTNVTTSINLDSLTLRTTDGITGAAADHKKSGSGYPVLVPGENVITIGGDTPDQIGILPRWRRI